jgi:hypothetical protein
MYSSPRFTEYDVMPWIGPDNTSPRLARDRGALTGAFITGVAFLADVFLTETLLATFFLPGALRETFLLTAFFLMGTLRATFFFVAFFFATFFLLGAFRAAFFLVTDFLAAFFLLAFFRAAGFFLATLFLVDFFDAFFATDFFRATDFVFFDVFFLLILRFLAGAFLRLDAFRAAAFLAAISNSCRSGKGGNYTLMAATWKPNLEPFSGHSGRRSPAPVYSLPAGGFDPVPEEVCGGFLGRKWALTGHLSDCCDNRFIAKIALHYPALTGYRRYTSTCDSARSSSPASSLSLIQPPFRFPATW